MAVKEQFLQFIQEKAPLLVEAMTKWCNTVADPKWDYQKYQYKYKDLLSNCPTVEEQISSIEQSTVKHWNTFYKVPNGVLYNKPKAGKEEVNPPVAPPDEEEEVLGELMEPTCVVEYTQFIHRIKMPTDEVLVDLYKSEREILYQCLYYGLGVRKKITERLKELLSEDEYSQLKTEFSEWRNTYMNTYGIDLDVLHPPKAMIDSRTSELKPSPPENTVEWFQYHYDGYVDYQGLKHRKPRKDIF